MSREPKKSAEQIILEVARKEFVANGYEGTRTEIIAKKAGYTKAMLHYYFRTKEKLFHEIVVQILNNNMTVFAAVMGKEGTFWEKVENLIDTYITTLLENPDIPFFIMSELSQKRESFVEEFKKRSSLFPKVSAFMQQMLEEMAAGRIKQMAPAQLLLSIMSMAVFPFMSKPVFCTILDFSEDQFTELMVERKAFMLDFLKAALKPD